MYRAVENCKSSDIISPLFTEQSCTLFKVSTLHFKSASNLPVDLASKLEILKRSPPWCRTQFDHLNPTGTTHYFKTMDR